MGAAPAQEGGAGRGGDWAAERNPPPGRGGWGKGAGGIFAGAFPPDDDRGAAISPLAGGAPIWVPPGPAQGGSQGASPARAGQRSAGADGAARGRWLPMPPPPLSTLGFAYCYFGRK